MNTGESLFVPIRGLRCHVRCWGDPAAPVLFMLHGWMHSSSAFQFVVDELQQDWRVLAPDFRGFGHSQWSMTTYWFPEFVADLEAILDHFSPQAPVNIVGHSFGAAVAAVYAGVRPHRIARYFNIDAFGARDWAAEGAPSRYVQLIDTLKKPWTARDYASLEELQSRMSRGEMARVPSERLAFLVKEWTRQAPSGRFELLNDPVLTDPFVMFLGNRLDDAMACWRAITAPMLMLVAREGSPRRRADDLSDGRLEERLAQFRTARIEWMDDAGHMVHIEHPKAVAKMVDDFFPFTHPPAYPQAA